MLLCLCVPPIKHVSCSPLVFSPSLNREGGGGSSPSLNNDWQNLQIQPVVCHREGRWGPAQNAMGPWPKLLVVVMTVRKAVRAATITFTAISIIRFVFMRIRYYWLRFPLLIVAVARVYTAAADVSHTLGAQSEAHVAQSRQCYRVAFSSPSFDHLAGCIPACKNLI